MAKAVRLAQYLRGVPRARLWFEHQGPCQDLLVHSDTDWAGCRRTRRSTTGGYAALGSHVLKTWCKTQATIALSSAEAELYGLVRASSECIGLASLHMDLGMRVRCTAVGDASAALAIVARKGVGRIRHLDTPFLWIQDQAAQGKVKYDKIDGERNGADLFTKSLPWNDIEKHVAKMNVEFVHSKSDMGYSLHMLQQGQFGVGLAALQEISNKFGDGKEIKIWHRLDLGVRTTKTSMKNGPEWSSVIGRVVVDASSGELLRSEPARDITRNMEHTLLPNAPRDTLTFLLYQSDSPTHRPKPQAQQQRQQHPLLSQHQPQGPILMVPEARPAVPTDSALVHTGFAGNLVFDAENKGSRG